ncbi:TolC family protein, partial [Burkholderia sp. SIMBA_042]|uniref:TolC family protein n=1 Tax=Burkholderia sp. SIMBA_042 TaxID=3085783 RepID=UPI00397CD716
ERPAAPVEAAYPQGDAYPAANGAGQVPPAAELGWRDYFADPRLQRLIEVALQNNRNLRVAALNMDAYRAQYRIQRADLFPQVGVAAEGTRQRVPAGL